MSDHSSRGSLGFLCLVLLGIAAASVMTRSAEETPCLCDPAEMDVSEKEAEPMSPNPANQLAGSTSPYLLQHADNPVNWHPWGEGAFEKARTEDKPIFLSIGYSACHWCHVMERESFENEDVARVLNEHFVAIKVDREERPDVDAYYMNAVQMMTGSGGWPLSVFLTPELKPYFGGTYFPPEDRHGMPGFRRVLLHAADLYHEHRDDIDQLTERLTGELAKAAEGPAAAGDVDGTAMDKAVAYYAKGFDATWGGFGSAPKFPPTGALAVLLRHHARTGDADALHLATHTLDRMAYGGLFDQLGGGFHRYATDRQWLVPHFEKMLYDNALLADVYLDAYRVTQNPVYLRVARETLDYVLREMTGPAGGFHSAQDADSEGVEGKYYVWAPEQIEQVLGAEDAALFMRYYGVTESGNFERHSILHVRTPLAEFAEQRGLDPDEFGARLSAMKQKLLAVRDGRVPPAKDDKVLADWNGLMISALARAYRVTGDDAYRAAAEKAARFVLSDLRPDADPGSDGELKHAWRDGRTNVDAFLDDYAFLLRATVDLYEATFDPVWIEHANSLAAEMTEKLWDAEQGGFYSAPAGGRLPVRTKEAHDSATPSGNAIAAHALLRLARLTQNNAAEAQAEKTLRLFFPVAGRFPAGFSRLLCAADFLLGPNREIVIAGDPAADATRELLGVVGGRYLPNAVTALIDPAADHADAAVRLLPPLAFRTLVDGRPAAYVCENYTCKAPVTTADPLRVQLEKQPPAE